MNDRHRAEKPYTVRMRLHNDLQAAIRDTSLHGRVKLGGVRPPGETDVLVPFTLFMQMLSYARPYMGPTTTHT